MKKLLAKIFSKHVIYITLIVFGLMKLGSAVPLDFQALNPFKKGLEDYDVTDLVFSKFKDINKFPDERIVLVNIGKPDRTEIISLLQKIQSYKPSVIGLDIHFEEYSETPTDSLLRKTLMAQPNIISVKKLGGYNPSALTYSYMDGCHDFFCDSIEVSYSNFYASLNKTIRRFSPKEIVDGTTIYAYGSALAMAYDSSIVETFSKRNYECEIINYSANSEGFITVDKSMILESNTNMEETFKGRIIMVGYLGADEWAESIKDKFFTPLNAKLASKSIPDMYGLVIHANIVSMLLDQKYVNILPGYLTTIINLFLIFIMVHIFRKVFFNINSGYWKVVRVIQLVLFASLFLIISGIMYFFNLKLELAIGVVGAVLSWDVVKFYYNVIVGKQRFFKKSNS